MLLLSIVVVVLLLDIALTFVAERRSFDRLLVMLPARIAYWQSRGGH